MNENFVEVVNVTVDIDIPSKCISYTVGEYISAGRIKKIWLASLGDFMCIKMLVETETGDRDFAKFIRLDCVESIEALYV